VVVFAEEFHVLMSELLLMRRVSYRSPFPVLVLREYEVPELRKSVEPVQVVEAPPTLFVKVPPTESVAPLARVKAPALVSEVLLVEVALLAMVQPPVPLERERL
jgi:hypothetical protein